MDTMAWFCDGFICNKESVCDKILTTFWNRSVTKKRLSYYSIYVDAWWNLNYAYSNRLIHCSFEMEIDCNGEAVTRMIITNLCDRNKESQIYNVHDLAPLAPLACYENLQRKNARFGNGHKTENPITNEMLETEDTRNQPKAAVIRSRWFLKIKTDQRNHGPLLWPLWFQYDFNARQERLTSMHTRLMLKMRWKGAARLVV